MKLIVHPDPILSQQCSPYDAGSKDDAIKLAEMTEFFHSMDIRPYGLAAPQVGWDARVLIMQAALDLIEIMINPELLAKSDQMVTGSEACLSFPWLKPLKITRHYAVDISYRTLLNYECKRTLQGLYSRIFQHEFDHLNGITIDTHRRNK